MIMRNDSVLVVSHVYKERERERGRKRERERERERKRERERDVDNCYGTSCYDILLVCELHSTYLD